MGNAKADQALWVALKADWPNSYAGDLKKLEAALRGGASPDATNDEGETALGFAASCTSSVDCLKALIKAGASLDKLGPDGTTPFAAALSGGTGAPALILLEAGADPLIAPTVGRSPFQDACFYGLVEIVDRLIARGADVNALENGESPIAQAVYVWGSRAEQSKLVIERLRAAGAKVDASALKYMKKLKGKQARVVAGLLGVAPRPPRKVKPVEQGAFRHPLFQRLKAYAQLLEQRGDLEFRTPLKMDTTPCEELDEPYPSDATSFAESATGFSFSYRVLGEPNAQGWLHLSLTGAGDQVDFTNTAYEECYELDCDGEGVGTAAWFLFNEGKGSIVWSVEDNVRFKSLTDYLTKGARRAFGSRWQNARDKRADAALLVRSVPLTTPIETLRKALRARVAPAMADDLVDWLGERVALLIPRESPPEKIKPTPKPKPAPKSKP